MEWSGKDLEGSGCGLIEVLSQHLPRGTVENHDNLRVVSALVDIRTKRLANKRLVLPLDQPAQ
jgi:hypothetical protein